MFLVSFHIFFSPFQVLELSLITSKFSTTWKYYKITSEVIEDLAGGIPLTS